MKFSRIPLIALTASLSLTAFACVEEEPIDGAEDGADGTDDGADEGGETPADPDSDQDGLTDSQEAELGTDPNDKDSDNDNYWDGWEVAEGTNPLDASDRIYHGYWPYNPDKDELEQGSFGTSTTAKGSPFPRAEFIDQHGDLVDFYDFANSDYNQDGQPSFFLVDMSAMWCGPCHNLADWVAGVPNEATAYFEQNYPSVPDKVDEFVIWWVTFIVENSGGGAPSLGDVQSWYQSHPDSKIPLFVDDTQGVRNLFNGGQYPFIFLLDPELKVEYWKYPTPNDNAYQALFYVENYL